MFLSEEILDNAIYKSALQEQWRFVRNGRLDMKFILERFVIHFDELYGDRDERFLEDAESLLEVFDVLCCNDEIARLFEVDG